MKHAMHCAPILLLAMTACGGDDWTVRHATHDANPPTTCTVDAKWLDAIAQQRTVDTPLPTAPAVTATPVLPQPCIDIRTAGAERLVQLSGVGPKRAADIVAMRERKPFTKLRHLKRVKGIGSKTLAKLKPQLCDF